jgi:hypothetical protein
MFVGTGPANIFGERIPCKKCLSYILDEIIYFEGTTFQPPTKPLFTSQNRVEIS